MDETKIDTFDVATRMRVGESAEWRPWTVFADALTPREARARMIQHAAYWIARDWSVAGLNRAEITLDSPEGGARMVVRMRKEA